MDVYTHTHAVIARCLWLRCVLKVLPARRGSITLAFCIVLHMCFATVKLISRNFQYRYGMTMREVPRPCKRVRSTARDANSIFLMVSILLDIGWASLGAIVAQSVACLPGCASRLLPLETWCQGGSPVGTADNKNVSNHVLLSF